MSISIRLSIADPRGWVQSFARRGSAQDKNLTQVTGHKLAAGFLTGHHTTTMQDCCKPACAWTEEVGGNEGQKKAVIEVESRPIEIAGIRFDPDGGGCRRS